MMKKRLFSIVLCLFLLACTAPKPDAQAPSPSASETPAPTPETQVVPVAKTEAPTEEPTDTPEPTPAPEPPLSGIKIGLDPGHQTHPNRETEPVAPESEEQKAKCSAGTRGVVSEVYEYEAVLLVAKKLAALLEAQGATVVLTRTENDVNISNRERAEFFNEHAVDLAIRLHMNGTDDPNVRGAFMLVPTRDHTAFYAENVRAAKAVIEHYCKETGLETRKGGGVTYRADQTGFNWCTRPIICIELGHMSNETEDLLLTNDAFQDKMAVGILSGILAYFSDEGGNP